jgi:hypothetical protein
MRLINIYTFEQVEDVTKARTALYRAKLYLNSFPGDIKALCPVKYTGK